MNAKGTLTRVVPPDDGKRQRRTLLATQLDKPGTFLPPPALMLCTPPEGPMVSETVTFADVWPAARTNARHRRETPRRLRPTTAEICPCERPRPAESSEDPGPAVEGPSIIGPKGSFGSLAGFFLSSFLAGCDLASASPFFVLSAPLVAFGEEVLVPGPAVPARGFGPRFGAF